MPFSSFVSKLHFKLPFILFKNNLIFIVLLLLFWDRDLCCTNWSWALDSCISISQVLRLQADVTVFYLFQDINRNYFTCARWLSFCLYFHRINVVFLLDFVHDDNFFAVFGEFLLQQLLKLPEVSTVITFSGIFHSVHKNMAGLALFCLNVALTAWTSRL